MILARAALPSYFSVLMLLLLAWSGSLFAASHSMERWLGEGGGNGELGGGRWESTRVFNVVSLYYSNIGYSPWGRVINVSRALREAHTVTECRDGMILCQSASQSASQSVIQYCQLPPDPASCCRVRAVGGGVQTCRPLQPHLFT